VLIGENDERTKNLVPGGKPIPRTEPNPERLKRCTGPCGEWLPIDCFQRDKARADGRRGDCRACRKERRAELKAGAEKRSPWSSRKLIVTESTDRS